MKRTTKDGQQIGFIKKGLSILTVSIDAAGNPSTIGEETFDTEPECNHNYSMIEFPEVADPTPVAPWPIQTRGEASQLGQSKYYTGRNCKYGHISQRYVSSGLCISCISARSKGFKRNRDAARNGLVPVSLMLHPDDAKAVQDYAAVLKTQRGSV